MNAKKQDWTVPDNRSSSDAPDREVLAARKVPLSAASNTLEDDLRRIVATRIHDPESISFYASSKISRASKIAAVAALEDMNFLVSLATAEVPSYVCRDALLRIDELRIGEPVQTCQLDRLTPCLNNSELLAFTVELMEASRYNWWDHCTQDTVTALCIALHECQSIHETVLLEDAFAQLMQARPELGKNLLACSPGKLHLKAMYAPLVINNMVYVDLTKEDNVA